MEGERLERLGYLTTEFQRPRSRRDNAGVGSSSVSSNSTRRRLVTNARRGAAASSNSPPYYTQKRENADKHDRIKAATNFNADWVLIAYVSILGAPTLRRIRRQPPAHKRSERGSGISGDAHDKG